jgi:GntR family transcriptional regulator
MPQSAEDSRPPYVRIADSLRDLIKDEKFDVGEPLPSVRKLADEYKAAPNTVASAIRLLREEGLVSSQQGKGHFVRSKPVDSAPSTEFSQVMAALDSLQQEVQKLNERVEVLEGGRKATAPAEPPGR